MWLLNVPILPEYLGLCASQDRDTACAGPYGLGSGVQAFEKFNLVLPVVWNSRYRV